MNTILCEQCNHYQYDEDYEAYLCDVNMDEDDYGRVYQSQNMVCPFFSGEDEYQVVRKQM